MYSSNEYKIICDLWKNLLQKSESELSDSREKNLIMYAQKNAMQKYIINCIHCTFYLHTRNKGDF